MYHHPVINLKNKELSRDIIHGSFLNWIVVAFLVTFYQFFCVSVGCGGVHSNPNIMYVYFFPGYYFDQPHFHHCHPSLPVPSEFFVDYYFSWFLSTTQTGMCEEKVPERKKERLKNNFNRTGGTPILYFLVRFDRRHTRVVSYLLWYKCQK
jgi:hypothetical protein